jgi:hypothetical protein
VERKEEVNKELDLFPKISVKTNLIIEDETITEMTNEDLLTVI